MKKSDAIIVIFAAVLALIIYAVMNFSHEECGIIAIYKDGVLYGEYPAEENRTVALGGNTVVIENGCAYMAEADCPDKLCIKQGKICSSAASIICLPNRVIVTASGRSGVDIISR